MKNTCLIVADRARARFFTVRAGEHGARLDEVEGIANPEGKRTAGDLFGRERHGPARAPGGGPSHNYDDHRESHLVEIGKRFAREVAPAIIRFASEHAVDQVVLVAEPQFLGLLRGEFESSWPPRVTRVDLAEEMSWHSVSHLEQVLTLKGMLPQKARRAAERV